MSKLAGVKLEKDVSGRIRKVTLDMKHHARFIEDYLDRLEIAAAKKNAVYVEWNEVKAELDKKHGLNSKELHSSLRAQGRKTA